MQERADNSTSHLKEGIPINHFNKEIVSSNDKHPYPVSVFTPENPPSTENELNSTKKRIAIIVFPGAGDTAASSERMALSVAENLQIEQQRRETNHSDQNFAISTAIQMPSVIAKDVIDSNKDRVARLESFVATIDKILKDNPTDELFLVGQSMGGQNLPELINIIKNKYPDLKIAGTIFFQSGGLFEQKGSELIRSLVESNKLEHEISQNFPTKLDIAVLKGKIREAKDNYDNGLALRLSSDLQIMETNYENLKLDTIQEAKKDKEKKGKLPSSRIGHTKIKVIFKRIDELTDDIDHIIKPKSLKRKQIQRQRQELIMKIISHLVSDPITGDTWEPPIVTIEAGKEAFLSENQINKQISSDQAIILAYKNIILDAIKTYAKDKQLLKLFLKLPQIFKDTLLSKENISRNIALNQTEAINFPVAVVWAEKDVIFNAMKAHARTGQLSKLFSKSPQIYDVLLNNMGHKPHEFNPGKFGLAVSDIITRMKFDETETKTTSLKY